jgi:DNA polymerase-3 subunit chi
MQVDFYHLAGSPLERIAARIAERVIAGGGRLLIVADDPALLDRLDGALWSYSDESFLPHGRAGEGDEALQPVLLAPDIAAANGARNVALADGRWRDEALGFERAFHFFDEASIGAARQAWKGLAGRDGVERNFWKQGDDGRWGRVA